MRIVESENPEGFSGFSLALSICYSVAIGADADAHARSSETDTRATVIAVTPAVDITLAVSRSVSI
jgi:hypothetical protein